MITTLGADGAPFLPLLRASPCTHSDDTACKIKCMSTALPASWPLQFHALAPKRPKPPETVRLRPKRRLHRLQQQGLPDLDETKSLGKILPCGTRALFCRRQVSPPPPESIAAALTPGAQRHLLLPSPALKRAPEPLEFDRFRFDTTSPKRSPPPSRCRPPPLRYGRPARRSQRADILLSLSAASSQRSARRIK